eukprot:719037_1
MKIPRISTAIFAPHTLTMISPQKHHRTIRTNLYMISTDSITHDTYKTDRILRPNVPLAYYFASGDAISYNIRLRGGNSFQPHPKRNRPTRKKALYKKLKNKKQKAFTAKMKKKQNKRNFILVESRNGEIPVRDIQKAEMGFVGRIAAVVPPPRIISMMQWKQEVNGNEKKQIKTSETKRKKIKMDAELQSLRIYKPKVREGYIDKFVDGYNAIGTDMFQKGTDISLFVGLKVELETRFHEVGTISASFGDSGNFYITFKQKVKRKRSQKWKPKVYLKSRKFLFQKSNGMTQ